MGKSIEIMTKTKRQLEDAVAYGRGISFDDWAILIEYRREALIKRGLDPNNYNLGSRQCTRKI